ncbi:hypothetical protein CA600_29145 [Paenibacillus sp. VTT E-133280]|uniref:hypothetical protein n=1 Tax=Paenibacillus sp. VTT E-133280 TaxID=1986222 RepID=UPI000BA1476F|nr:hypothetical protein [Paenibacillus sp. VTT E-133280]OZQ60154.1 hypothetical protein CA600_29145 [Paenibacillus sp. VTT E-133280]
MDNILLIIFGIILLVFIFSVFILIIRSAIDGSNTSKKMDVLIDEIRMLRIEIKSNKHIIDKKV